MATDDPVVDTVRIAVHREKLPTVSDVEEWTEEELFSFIQSKNILRNDKNRTTFQNAEISGAEFLMGGAVRQYWTQECHLPLGPSTALAELAQQMKGASAELSQGNEFLCFLDVAGSV
jgi:hypothetical protein